MDATTQSATVASFIESMTERMASLARSLGAWVQAEPRTLQAQEEQVVRQLHDLGTALLTGLLALAPAPTARTVVCPCGAQARYRRLRPATVTTLLGTLTYSRATYSCASCHQGHAPLDLQLQVAAGSIDLYALYKAVALRLELPNGVIHSLLLQKDELVALLALVRERIPSLYRGR